MTRACRNYATLNRGAQIPLPWTAGYVPLRDHATAMDYLEGLIAR